MLESSNFGPKGTVEYVLAGLECPGPVPATASAVIASHAY